LQPGLALGQSRQAPLPCPHVLGQLVPSGILEPPWV